MMRVLWKSTLRWPLQRPWQALLAIVGVAMGVAVVAAPVKHETHHAMRDYGNEDII